jgi:calmodulin
MMHPDGDGSISFEEFVAVMSRKVQATYSKDQVKVAFHVFENSSYPNGFVRAEDLINALQIYGAEKLTKQQAIDLVRQLDVDQNGLINYDEYVNMMMSS